MEGKGEKVWAYEKWKNRRKKMKNDFKGTGISDTKYQAICDAFTDYTAIIEDWIICDGNKLKSIITSGEYVKIPMYFPPTRLSKIRQGTNTVRRMFQTNHSHIP